MQAYTLIRPHPHGHGFDEIVVLSEPMPLPELDVPQPTEPAHFGATWQQPAPQRRTGRRDANALTRLALAFDTCPIASLAIACALVAACAVLAVVIPMGPAQ